MRLVQETQTRLPFPRCVPGKETRWGREPDVVGSAAVGRQHGHRQAAGNSCGESGLEGRHTLSAGGPAQAWRCLPRSPQSRERRGRG